ncbi:hypothetical protein ACFQ61_32550 [Streptomyces sp. NPDC056500]|uniref:hypothetical protein n=1 Tax=Streptomyces sp. NPDC056500 TaxID=3345840 RepID=UPI0036A683A7
MTTELLLIDQSPSEAEGIIETQGDLVRRHVVRVQPSHLIRSRRRDHDNCFDQHATTR